MNLLFTIVILVICQISLGFTYNSNNKISKIYNNVLSMNNNDARQLNRIIVSSLLPISLFLNPMLNNNKFEFISIKSVHADFRAQQKRSYFRFIPKLKTGLAYYKTDLKNAIDTEDWKTIEKFFEVYVKKYNKNDPTEVESTESYVNKYFYRPMTIFAGTFAERGTSPKQEALIEQEEAFKKEMFKLENCIKDMKGEGFFAADIKMPEGPARKFQAEEAWTKGKDILNKYIQIANDGLMLELNKVDQI